MTVLRLSSDGKVQLHKNGKVLITETGEDCNCNCCNTFKDCKPNGSLSCPFTVPSIWKITPSESTTTGTDFTDSDCELCCGDVLTEAYAADPENIDGLWPQVTYDPETDTDTYDYENGYHDLVPYDQDLPGCRWFAIDQTPVSDNGRFLISQHPHQIDGTGCEATPCNFQEWVRFAIGRSGYTIPRWLVDLWCGRDEYGNIQEDEFGNDLARLRVFAWAEWSFYPGGFPNIPVPRTRLYVSYSTGWISFADLTSLIANAEMTPITLPLETIIGKDVSGNDDLDWSADDFTSDSSYPPSPYGCDTVAQSVDLSIPSRAMLRLLAGCDRPCNPYPTRSQVRLDATVFGTLITLCMQAVFNEETGSVEYNGQYSPISFGPSCDPSTSILFRLHCYLAPTDEEANEQERRWVLDVTYKGKMWTIELTPFGDGFDFNFSDTLDAVCDTPGEDFGIEGMIQECESDDPEVCCPPPEWCGCAGVPSQLTATLTGNFVTGTYNIPLNWDGASSYTGSGSVQIGSLICGMSPVFKNLTLTLTCFNEATATWQLTIESFNDSATSTTTVTCDPLEANFTGMVLTPDTGCSNVTFAVEITL